MLQRAPFGQTSAETVRERSSLFPYLSIVYAGLMGGAGVGIAAAGAHVGGGDLARTSSDFLLIHAAVVSGGSAAALGIGGGSRILAAALALFMVGATLFGGELALAGLLDWRPWPPAAPIGGLCLIGGWIVLSIFGIQAAWRR